MRTQLQRRLTKLIGRRPGHFGSPTAELPGERGISLPDCPGLISASAIKHLLVATARLLQRSELLPVMLCNDVARLQQFNALYSEQLIRAVYRRYMSDARREPGLGNFGSTCPEPSAGIFARRK